eukprot:TRINITY_DN77812_c0_g1_i1.p1 TRINITY_DN77812_c0_g1~~TRINITY_DN77812_c0_g1_i1.p1  ORF type:complete len:521 (+),score=117.53 TRINITY_DN77812_c0_g1_i1:67-1629(+)
MKQLLLCLNAMLGMQVFATFSLPSVCELEAGCDSTEHTVSLVQSAKEKRPAQVPAVDRVAEYPLESFAEDLPAAPQSKMTSQLLQISGQAMQLAQTKVQTKVGEAPILIIAIAIAGFGISLMTICVTSSLILLRKADTEDGDERGHAAALLAQRLRAMGIGQKASSRRMPFGPAWSDQHTKGIPELQTPHGGPGSHQVSGPVQYVTVPQPLEGGRLGLMLSDDDLVVNSFGDLGAAAFGFQIGDRLTRINGIPVFKERDFRYIMSNAVQQNANTGKPIVFEVWRNYTANSGALPQLPNPGNPGEGDDVSGTWYYGVSKHGQQYTYSVNRVGNKLLFEQQLPNSEKVRAELITGGELSPWIEGRLVKENGDYFGEIRLTFEREDQTMTSQLKMAGADKWGDEVHARRRPAAEQLPMQSSPAVGVPAVPTALASQSPAAFPGPPQTMLPGSQAAAPQDSAAALPYASLAQVEGAVPQTQPIRQDQESLADMEKRAMDMFESKRDASGMISRSEANMILQGGT